ncbi:MAG TPA: lytic transglycosylase domain-containing protein, partial [Streptosporangiaceae bacterium]
MQFLAATWQAYGVDADHDGTRNVYDPADAIHGAARYLCASGAKHGTQQRIRRALYAYNHAWWSVDLVLATAARYAAPPVSGVAAKVIAYVRAQLGKPYRFSGGPGGGITVDPRVCPAQMADAGNLSSATDVVQAGLDPVQR